MPSKNEIFNQAIKSGGANQVIKRKGVDQVIKQKGNDQAEISQANNQVKNFQGANQTTRSGRANQVIYQKGTDQAEISEEANHEIKQKEVNQANNQVKNFQGANQITKPGGANQAIKRICQAINYQDILDKKFYAVWFFTNERINYFLPKLEDQVGIKKVFSIGGGGDLAFSLLANCYLKIEEIKTCDIRPMANISLNFKIALFKNLEYEEILNLFLKRKIFYKEQVYSRIRETISPLSRKVFDFIIAQSKEANFLSCLRKSGLWYKDSFWQIKNRQDYLPYLTSAEKYQCLQKNLEKISIYSGDFNDNLKLFPNNYFDLIYVSNIFDSQKYCRSTVQYLQTIKEKITNNGLLFVIVQDRPKKIIKLITEEGFFLHHQQINKFKLISSLLGHYSYSFLLFKRNL